MHEPFIMLRSIFFLFITLASQINKTDGIKLINYFVDDDSVAPISHDNDSNMQDVGLINNSHKSNATNDETKEAIKKMVKDIMNEDKEDE